MAGFLSGVFWFPPLAYTILDPCLIHNSRYLTKYVTMIEGKLCPCKQNDKPQILIYMIDKRLQYCLVFGFIFCVLLVMLISTSAMVQASTRYLKNIEEQKTKITSGGPQEYVGLISDPSVLSSGIDASGPAVAFTNCEMEVDQKRYLVAWHYDHSDTDEIFGQLINSDGSKFGSWVVIGDDDNANRRNPAIAHNCDANEFLVVWEFEDADTGVYGIQARRLDAISGQPLEQQPGLPYINIVVDGRISSQPRVAYSSISGIYLVILIQHGGHLF
jgi:hypothetical protein